MLDTYKVLHIGVSLNYQATPKGLKSRLEGANFYRLRQVDLDGTFTYSPIININYSNPGEHGVAYPNPFESRFVIPLNGDLKQFSLYTSEGRNVTRTIHLTIEEDSMIIKGDHLAVGMYWVRYNDRMIAVVKK